MRREMSQNGFSRSSRQEYDATMQPNRERGATAVEYGLFVALIAAVIIGTVTTLGSATSDLFEPVTTFFTGRGY